MGYVPPAAPFRPNLDRFGMPRDYATYQWATYGEGRDIPPERRAFLHPEVRQLSALMLFTDEALDDWDPRKRSTY